MIDRQHILDEIKRTAKANGGKALGRESFEKETGIKESDWSGRYWARWGDAVREAGLAPNRMNPPLATDAVIGKLAAFIRQLGHFPVMAEMRLRKRADATFPNDKVYSRFGRKAQLVEAVLAYCERQADFEDVAAICKPLLAPAAEEVSGDDDGDEAQSFGFVYLIKSGRHYKIGRSNAAGRREREIALQLPEKANTVHVIRTDDPVGIETYWHQRFAEKRLNGEWFALTAADVRAFKRRKFQ